MKLYLMQHGRALSKEEDAARPLSEAGRRETARVLALLAPLGLAVHEIRHSGKTRAAETAEMLSGAVASARGLVAAEGLQPKDPVEATAEALHAETEDVALVGHLPHLERLAALLLAGDPEAGAVAFQPGGVVRLERDATGRWRLEWAVVPALFEGTGGIR